MTVAELDHWALHRNWGPRRHRERFAFVDGFTIIMPDRALCRTWADVADRARRDGRPIQVAAAGIAATAIALGVPLVTNNRADYLGVPDLRLLPDPGA